MSEERKFNWVGTRPIRPDGLDKVTGRANFGADLTLPGMLWAKVLRSPHAHAKIRSIDVAPALAIEGVKAVITGADLPDPSSELVANAEGAMGSMSDLARVILARKKVLYDGHAVAAVAATTTTQAEKAVAAIRVDYEVLEPVLDIDSAMAPGAPILHEGLRTRGLDPPSDEPTNVASRTQMGRGDVDKGFEEADVVVEREFTTKMVHQGYIEPHAVVARTGEDGQSVVWCCTQGHFVVRAMCAGVLGMDISEIKVIPSEIGGGFGGKTTVYLEPLAILLSRKTGRPVKLVMTRDEVFRATGPTSGSKMRVKMGATKDGTLTAADATLMMEAGAFPGSPVTTACMCMFAPFNIPATRMEGLDVVVNKPKTAAYRAPGAPMGAFGAESVMDELAEKLGIDVLEFRLKNAIHEGMIAAYGPKFGPIGLVETLEVAKNHPHYKAPLGPNQGRGVASGFWFNVGMQSSANISLNENGTVNVVTGNPDIGGSRASMALMAAEELQIPVDQVKPQVADTDTIGYSDLTGGSRVTYATGMAVIEAARSVVDDLRQRAAALWEVEVDSVKWEDGNAVSEDGEKTLSIGELARSAGRTGGPILGRGAVNAASPGPAFATHICDVEVDKETGKVDVIRYTTIQDAGKAVHPSYVEGQMQGGASQGIGWALNEEYIYDEKGNLENPGFLDYRMPVASDLPMIDTVIVEVPNPGHPYGVRGVGEAPIVPPLAAVANAVSHATGVRMVDLPMSPPHVLEAIDRAG
ncbi:MAG: xanthine dehydrogenase family protein molybdopterin-binding subunit [Myxococcota bacterium]